MSQPTLINVHPNEYSQEFRWYTYVVKLDRCVGNCDILNDLSYKVCVPNRIEDLNLSVFNMIIGINESKILTCIMPMQMSIWWKKIWFRPMVE